MNRILTLSLANVAGSLHYYLILYVASSYLGRFLPDAQVGLVFSVAAGLMMLGFIVAPRVLMRLSVRRVALILSFADLVSILLLASGPGPVVATVLIALQSALAPLISYTLDLFLENATPDEGLTGHVRGLFLTAGNVALVTSPILLGVVLDATNDYSRIFLSAAGALMIFIVILMTRARFIVDRQITNAGSLATIMRCLVHNVEVRSVLIANFILQSFYAWVSIYIPLYLHQSLGMTWDAIGPLFALMLLPFLLIELPMGFAEDKFKGARLVMGGGFAIMALSLMAFSSVTTETGFAFVAIVLVLTRVGAALVEITSEVSFFRDVDGQDAEVVSFFRMTRPLGMLVGPLVGSFFLLALPLQYLFVPLGILCLLGIPFARKIKDGVTPGVRTRVCPVR